MKYFLAKFKKELPSGPGIKLVASFTGYSLFEVTDEVFENFNFGDVRWEEVSEYEGVHAWKYYGEVRGYRSAYSDAEGLTPDPDELAKGKRKTKIYLTKQDLNETARLMKRVFKMSVQDEFDTRESRDGEAEILALIDSLTTIKEINYEKERLLGIEMPKHQLQEIGVWDDYWNSRKGKMHYNLGF